jgi:hypothetical protein
MNMVHDRTVLSCAPNPQVRRVIDLVYNDGRGADVYFDIGQGLVEFSVYTGQGAGLAEACTFRSQGSGPDNMRVGDSQLTYGEMEAYWRLAREAVLQLAQGDPLVKKSLGLEDLYPNFSSIELEPTI